MPFFDALKKRPKNDQKIKNHCGNLISQYIQYAETLRTDNLPDIFRNLPNNELFLYHLSTGYETTYSLLLNYFTLQQEIKTIAIESVWKEKTKQSDKLNLEFKHEFDRILLKTTRGGEDFQGICPECKNWHNEDEYNYKELISKLNLFKMPFENIKQ